MALPHANPLDPIDVRPLGTGLAEAVSVSLIKTEHLQLMRTVLRMGASLPQHHVAGEMTIQCLEGEVALSTPARELRLGAGQLALLPPHMPYAVKALLDTSLLMTVLLHVAP